MYHCYMESPVGLLEIVADEQAIKQVKFTQEAQEEHSNALCKACELQLQEYFAGKRKSFDLPLEPDGTLFQKTVWKALYEIPYGETRSYQDIAIAADRPKACRAVGMANNHNPIAIIIPCHRVIGKGGKMVGYGGGLDKKELLLALEQNKS